jgi:hypothetical protein
MSAQEAINYGLVDKIIKWNRGITRNNTRIYAEMVRIYS